MTSETGQKVAYLVCFVIICVAIVGYFVGLQSPMNPIHAAVKQRVVKLHASATRRANSERLASDVILATEYKNIGEQTRKRTNAWKTSLVDLKSDVDPLAETIITPEQKSFALAYRERNRAFNGAPPTVPHPIDQLSSQACLVCHGSGVKTESLRISKMSHQFLTNCTQCHAENDPRHMPASLFRENSFVGLPAPTEGPRAFAGAPPMIPHSTWMRVDCTSCHGVVGLTGIRSTHPWRQNCQQCHAPSSQLDQVEFDPAPNFLPPPSISQQPRD